MTWEQLEPSRSCDSWGGGMMALCDWHVGNLASDIPPTQKTLFRPGDGWVILHSLS